MPRWLQILLHGLTVATGSYLAYEAGNPLPLVVSSGVNALIGGIAQSYNPDGSPATVPYVKASKPFKVR